MGRREEQELPVLVLVQYIIIMAYQGLLDNNKELLDLGSGFNICFRLK